MTCQVRNTTWFLWVSFCSSRAAYYCRMVNMKL